MSTQLKITHNVTHDVSCGALTSNDKMAFSWDENKTSKLNSKKSAVNTYLFFDVFKIDTLSAIQLPIFITLF